MHDEGKVCSPKCWVSRPHDSKARYPSELFANSVAGRGILDDTPRAPGPLAAGMVPLHPTNGELGDHYCFAAANKQLAATNTDPNRRVYMKDLLDAGVPGYNAAPLADAAAQEKGEEFRKARAVAQQDGYKHWLHPWLVAELIGRGKSGKGRKRDRKSVV